MPELGDALKAKKGDISPLYDLANVLSL